MLLYVQNIYADIPPSNFVKLFNKNYCLHTHFIIYLIKQKLIFMLFFTESMHVNLALRFMVLAYGVNLPNAKELSSFSKFKRHFKQSLCIVLTQTVALHISVFFI